MVQDAKHVAINPADANAVSRWRESNKAVSVVDKFVIENAAVLKLFTASECSWAGAKSSTDKSRTSAAARHQFVKFG